MRGSLVDASGVNSLLGSMIHPGNCGSLLIDNDFTVTRVPEEEVNSIVDGLPEVDFYAATEDGFS